MMKRILLATLWVCSFGMVAAQTVIVQENFNGCALPAGWTTTGSTTSWSFDDNFGDNLTGTCMAYYDDDAAGSGAPAANLSLVSPYFNLSNQASASLIFTYNFNDFTGETFTADIWNKTTGTWVNLLTVSGVDDCGAWGTCTYPTFNQDITAYLSDSVRIRFTYDDGGGNWGWYVGIDDVQVVFYPPNDVGCTKIISPVSGCQLTASENVTVEVQNFGSAVADSVLMTLWKDGTLIATEVWAANIPAFSAKNYTFSTPVNAGAVGPHTIKASAVYVGGDISNTNDTTTQTVTKSGNAIASFPYLETFDNFATCGFGSCADNSCPLPAASGWSNPSGDGDDWEAATGATSSFATGPDADHTTGAGIYLYTEASGCVGAPTVETPCFDFSALNAPQVSFWYHMYGVAMGTLELQILSGSSGGWKTVWSKSGDQGNQWWEAKVPLIQYAGEVARFRFVGTIGVSFESDMAIDDFKVGELPLFDATPVGFVSPAATSNCPVFANAETVTVKWANIGGDTLTNIAATLWLNNAFVATENITGTFYSGDTVSYTFTAALDLSAFADHQIQVAMSATPTDNDPFNDTMSVTIVHDGVVSVFPYEENFDAFKLCGNTNFNCNNNICDTAFTSLGWTNIEDIDDADWSVGQGATPNSTGGPTGDHTTGGGNYLFMDGNNCFNVVGLTETPCFDLAALNNPYLSFWYFMDNIGFSGSDSLRLQADSSGVGQWHTVASIGGAQGTQWKFFEQSLSAYMGKTVKFRLRGRTANSDVALDDFRVYEVFPKDATPYSLITPLDTACSYGSTETVAVRIRNEGSQSISNVPVELWVDGVFVVRDTVVGNIAAKSNKAHIFSQKANISASGVHEIAVVTKLPSDMFTANDSVVFKIGAGAISTYPYLETFDALANCLSSCTDGNCATTLLPIKWINANDAYDTDDWNVRSGPTPSSFSGTGPQGDHTSGAGKYLYVETSGCNNKRLTVVTPCFNLTGLSVPRVAFWYHMYGATIGKMTLQINAGAGWQTLWTKSGNQGNQWYEAVASLSSYANQTVKFRIVGISGTSFTSDFAIDDFFVGESPANEVGVTKIISPVVASQSCESLTASETITVEVANFGAATANNVPIQAIGATTGGTFTLNGTVPTIPVGGSVVYTFNNTMNLSAIGAFNLTVTTNLASDANTTNDAVTLNAENDGSQIITLLPYVENFDNWTLCNSACDDGLCAGVATIASPGWHNAAGDDSDWSIHSGATSSLNTGPDNDHTLGTGAGKYLYTEASGCNGSDFYMELPCFDFTSLYAPEISFWYHSQGVDAGTLRLQVDTTAPNGNWITVWTKTGTQGAQWNQAIVSLANYKGNITRLRFFATTGNGFESDIAIDDIRVRDVIPHDLAITTIEGLANGCGQATQMLDVTVYNQGFNTETNYTITVQMQGLNNQTIDTVVTAVPLTSEQTHLFSIGPFNTSLGGVYDFKTFVTINNATDLNVGNNNKVSSVIATKLSVVATNDTAVCGIGSATLEATGNAAQYYWYTTSTGGDYIHKGAIFQTPPITVSPTIFYVEGRNLYTDYVGKKDTSANKFAAGYNDYYPDGLKFDALFDITLDSVKLYPKLLSGANSGFIQINVVNAQGVTLGTVSTNFYGTVGDTTIALNISMPKGADYQINTLGSSDVEYYRIRGGVQYPFIIPGGIRIKGAINNLPGYYYNFYNLRVTFMGCPSGREAAIVTNLPSNITLDSTATSSSDNLAADGTATVIPTGGKAPFTFLWDAAAKSQTTATATNLRCGTYAVTVTDADGCQAIGSVTVGCFVNTDPITNLQRLEVYPNPTTGAVTLDVQLTNAAEIQVEIFNALGQRVMTTAPENVAAKRFSFDFANHASGIYQVRVRINDQWTTQSLLVTTTN